MKEDHENEFSPLLEIIFRNKKNKVSTKWWCNISVYCIPKVVIYDIIDSAYSAPCHYLTNSGLLSIGPLGTSQWNFKQNTILCIHKNAYEYIVYEMVAILPRVIWVNLSCDCIYLNNMQPAKWTYPHFLRKLDEVVICQIDQCVCYS